jgi:hypothetical protein
MTVCIALLPSDADGYEPTLLLAGRRVKRRSARLPSVAAEVQGRDEGDRSTASAVATNPELIAVTDPDRSKLVLLEGHVRLTAYAAFPELLPDELEVYLGTSPRVAEWCQW